MSSRFAGTIRLFGEDGFGRLQRAHICVVGVGGVGSWAVETLARSGVGMLTLIDGDVVVESNINRQLPALEFNLGKPKVSVLAQRIAEINPECRVSAVQQFMTPDNMTALIGEKRFDFVIDAIDSVRDKTALIAYCRDHGVQLITVGGAGGQMDRHLRSFENATGTVAGESQKALAFAIRVYTQSEKQVRYRCGLFS